MRAPIGNLALFVSAASALISGSAFAQDRNAYFGQTHQHTSWSLDAYLMGNTVTGPAEAYQYSMGETIKHPAGYDVKIKTPLDFQGVTDHSEYVGVMRLVNDPNSPISKLPVAATLRPSKDNTSDQDFPVAGRQPCRWQADQGVARPENHRIGLAEQYRDRRQVLQARQIHDVLRL